jgi:amino acid adenylation domain-containing protein
MDESMAQALPIPSIGRTDLQHIIDTIGKKDNIQEIHLLTPREDGMLLDALRGRGSLLSVQFLLELPDSMDVESLERAIQAVVGRHDRLRSTVLWDGLSQPVRVVLRQASIRVDPLRIPTGLQAKALALESSKNSRTVANWQRSPALYLQTIRLPGESHWYVLLHANQLVCDLISLEHVVGELERQLAGQQHETIAEQSLRQQEGESNGTGDAVSFFMGLLGDLDEPTAPFDLLSTEGDCTEEFQYVLSSDLRMRVLSQARNCGVSVAALLHAAWAIVISRASGREDIVYGSEVVGVHTTTSMLPLRIALHDTSVVDLVVRTECRLSELTKYGQVPLSVARRCSGVPGTEPLSGACLRYRYGDGGSRHRLKAPIVRVVALREPLECPIKVIISETEAELAIKVVTDGRIGSHRVASYLHTTLCSLAESLQLDPTKPARDLSILPAAELHGILESFNATLVPYPVERLIHELFEDRARRVPLAPALLYAGEQLTYSELNGRSNQLAHYLRGKAVQIDEPVALFFERGIDMVVALLAVLKAGGAVLPLDPAYPAQRVSQMICDAQPRLILTTGSATRILPSSNAQIIQLDNCTQQIADYPVTNLSSKDVGQTSESLLYVIYTSGSTGVPKAIAMSHRSIVNLMEWHHATFGDSSGRRVLQFAALSFDVAFQEIFFTLCSGGMLVLIDDRMRKDQRALAEFLIDQSIHRVFLPPLVLHSLAECYATASRVPVSLCDIVTAGEQLRVSPEITKLFERLRGCQLHNHYGPAETHVVTTLTLAGDPQLWPSLPSVGRPIHNTQIYVLDTNRQPTPLGVAGEIYIGGAGVARGYLRRPELTAQRFVGDPFSQVPGARLYKTGDLGRFLTDGTLEYLGRNDDQVKIRGFRIELGEIETRLATHPRVKDAVVIAREEVPGDKRLLAYVTTAGGVEDAGAEPIPDQLRAYLKPLLPEFMVPSAFVVIDRLPLSPNGKLDRNGLPKPGAAAHPITDNERPLGEVEIALASMWGELLGTDSVARDSNFFELGGHSVLGTKLMVRVAQRFDIKVPFHALFLSPTVREMAELVETLRHEQQTVGETSSEEFEEGIV